jgi:hypothetical protein
MTQQLSPAAQAVYDAAMNTPEHVSYMYDIATALRAAADQVVPMALCVHNDDFVYVRHQLHALAAELEAQ